MYCRLRREGRRNEHTDAHLIGSWDENPDGLEPELVDGRHDVAPLVRHLEQPVRACGRAPQKWVYHLVLRNDPGDRRLADAEWEQVCRAAMDRTGIAPAGDPAGCRWVAVRHADDHVHLVATLAGEDGRPPRVWNDYARLAEVAHEFEDRFGLRSTAGRDDHTAAPPTRGQGTDHRRVPPPRNPPRNAVVQAVPQQAPQQAAPPPTPTPAPTPVAERTSERGEEQLPAVAGDTGLVRASVYLDERSDQFLKDVRADARRGRPKVDASRSAVVRLALERLAAELGPGEVVTELRSRADAAPATPGRKRL